MPTVIRAADQKSAAGVAFNFDDMAVQAKSCLEKVQAEAAKIVAKAQAEAAAVRKRAELDGRQAAFQAVEQMVAKQLANVLPAMRQAVEQNPSREAGVAEPLGGQRRPPCGGDRRAAGAPRIDAAAGGRR